MKRSASSRYASSSPGVGGPLGTGRRLPALAADIEAAMERIVAEDGGWRHSDADGPNAPSHIRASLISPQVLVPLDRGELALGRWQGIFFCEFDGPRDRKVYVTPLG